MVYTRVGHGNGKEKATARETPLCRVLPVSGKGGNEILELKETLLLPETDLKSSRKRFRCRQHFVLLFKKRLFFRQQALSCRQPEMATCRKQKVISPAKRTEKTQQISL